MEWPDKIVVEKEQWIFMTAWPWESSSAVYKHGPHPENNDPNIYYCRMSHWPGSTSDFYILRNSETTNLNATMLAHEMEGTLFRCAAELEELAWDLKDICTNCDLMLGHIPSNICRSLIKVERRIEEVKTLLAGEMHPTR